MAAGAAISGITAVTARAVGGGQDLLRVLADAGPAGLGRAGLVALLVGGCLTAIPEELTFRRVLLTVVDSRGGGVLAVAVTAVAFTAVHVPTWIGSGLTGTTWAYQVADELAFVLVAG